MHICKAQPTEIKEGDSTSMIDMVFQLVAFFMVLINFNEADQNERIKLPGSELARPPDGAIPHAITLHVTRDGTVIYGGDEVQPSQLKRFLQSELNVLEFQNKKPGDATVVIRGDSDAKTGKVQEVIQECQRNKFDRFALRAKEERRK